nr:LysR family transcriptional regulator [Paracoccus sphaerophysae]
MAAEGSYAGAADRLVLTAPALHARIRALEDLFGTPMLTRSARGGSELTEIGRRVAQTAAAVEHQLARLAEDVGALRAGRTGRVVLRTVSTAKYFAPHFVQRLRATLPEIEVQLRVGNRQSVIEGLASGRMDLAIMGRPPRIPAVDAEILAPHPHLLIAAAGHRLAGMAQVPVAELLSETFILREEGSGTRILATRWLDQTGKGYPFDTVEMDSNETIKQAVMAGMGIALLSQHTVLQELADGRLVGMKVPGLPIMRNWFLVHRAGHPLSPTERKLHDAILGLRGMLAT